MKKVFLLFVFASFGLSACATAKVDVNAQNLQSQNEVQSKVVKERVKKMKIVLNFNADGYSALTFWRKINEDGSKGRRFSVGGASKFALFMNGGYKKSCDENISLEAGTYYLDSFQISVPSGYLVSQKKHFASRNGWDEENAKPKYLSFTVEEGKDLTLPKIKIIPVMEGNDYKAEDGYSVVKMELDGGDSSTLVFGNLVRFDKGLDEE